MFSSHGRGKFTPPGGGKIPKKGITQPPAKISKSISVKKKKGGGLVLLAKKIQNFQQGELG